MGGLIEAPHLINKMNFLQEVYSSEKFQELLKDNPVAAKLLFDDLSKSWTSMKGSYKEYRDLIRKNNPTLKCEGKGRMIASIPVPVVTWLEMGLDHPITSKELMDFVKKHPEFWVVDKL